jgi:predicted DNA-binding protein (MmcQ/YjbR family)
MKNFEEFFLRKKINISKCLKYGFKKTDSSYRYAFYLLNGEFEVTLEVTETGQILLDVVDVTLGEEFLPIFQKNRSPYAQMVYSALKERIQEITAVCFGQESFINPQSNRIVGHIYKIFHESPEYPFVKIPTYGVFRAPNNKWYALIMDLDKERFEEHMRRTVANLCSASKKGNSSCSSDMYGESSKVEIVNLKIDPSKKKELLMNRGVLPCYHMNHDNWISVILNDSVDDDFLMSLIINSRSLVFNETSFKEKKVISKKAYQKEL